MNMCVCVCVYYYGYENVSVDVFYECVSAYLCVGEYDNGWGHGLRVGGRSHHQRPGDPHSPAAATRALTTLLSGEGWA